MASTFLLGHTQKLTLPFSNFTSRHKPTLRPQNPYIGFPSNGGRSGYLFIRSPITVAKSNSKSDYHDDKKLFTPLKMAAGASLALACALSIFGFRIKNMSYTAAAAAHPSAADMIISGKPTSAVSATSGMYPLPAKFALRSLFEVSSMLASAKPIPSQRPFNLHKLPSLPSKEDIDSIKMEAVRKMKEGKCEEAVQLLRDANMRYKNEPEADFNVQMALVEILILLERYQEAAEYSCLNDENAQISDVRIPLYKAIIYTMLDKDTEAKQCWKEFRKSIGEGFDPFSFEE
ncbi:Tetratricopeptide-like helical domain superfamily [Arabidopsis thaliana x Arabidopsis arenosa]|uniref:Tetratricopeptide-like helical domain superfamily n=1 Tax=Arabidopsis thaliana x Arabidopsis arenosa TaxID=1240361 RepID=A0A8T2A8X0_9BRAS|nr:Tetratricopeptide-like helical domain superfamily [Arabidopsis thaliana x Arabidopsis arenosa]